MEFRYKVILSHCIIHLYMFISGLEFAVIFPTLWEYLQKLGVHDSYWFGLSISAMTVTDVVTGVIVGRIVDISNKVRFIVLILNIFQILGSFLYTISPSLTCLIASRLISGCGKSIAVVFLADICKSTTSQTRTPILLLFNIAGQLGLVLGPACNLFLRQIEFKLGWLEVNKLNVPGLFMFFLWFIFSVVVLFFYFDLVAIHATSVVHTETVTTNEYIDALVRNEVVAIVLIRFTALFCQTSLETMVPLIMKTYFNYDDVAISLFYLFAGLELLVIFLALTMASRYFTDRSLISSGLLLMMVSLIWLTATLPTFQPGNLSNLPFFAVGMGLELLGIPMVCDISIALYSKILPDRVQGLGHGVRRFISKLAFFLGPVWSSSTQRWPSLMLGVPLGLVVVSSMLFLASYKRMQPVSEQSSASQNQHTPLLT